MSIMYTLRELYRGFLLFSRKFIL